MEIKRTQVERSERTQEALIAAARVLFAERGYAAVGTDELARAAGVSRGALYHQFGDKTGLFAAVLERIEQELTEEIMRLMGAEAPDDPIEAMRAGVEIWLRASTTPEVHRILLLDAPAVLGWERWREIAAPYGLGMVEGVLEAARESGRIPDQPIEPLAHVLLGAIEEASLYAARAADRETATAQVRAVLLAMVDGLAVD